MTPPRVHIAGPAREAASMAEPVRQRYFAGLSRNTFLLACASLFADISTEMLYPVLPVFLTQILSASGSVVGLIDGVAQATQNIVQGFSGWLSDKLRKRKPIALAGYLLAAIAKPLMGLVDLLARRAGRAFPGPARRRRSLRSRDALVASSADEEHRGKAFGLEGVGDNLGAFLGPLLAVGLLYVLAGGYARHFLPCAGPRPSRRAHDRAGDGTARRGRGKVEARRQLAAISRDLLEISERDRVVRDRQFQQCVSDSADAGRRRLAGDDHPHLRRLQFGGRTDLVPGGISVRQVGTKEHPARIVHHLLHRLSGICVDAGMCS